MIRIICGTCETTRGCKTSADGPITLPAAEERRLVLRGVAEYETRPIIGPDTAPVPRSGGGEEPEAAQDPGASEAAQPATGGEEDGSIDEEVARMERMSKGDLESMARDMVLDVSGAKTKHDLAVLIAAADSGDEPPELDAVDIVR